MQNENSIVNPDGRYELLAKKLESFKVNNLTAKEQEAAKSKEEAIGEIKKSFAASFIHLCWQLIGISRSQLAQMTEEELCLLDELYVGKKAGSKLRWRLWMLFTPFDWHDAFYCHDQNPAAPILRYYAEKKRLQKIYGKDYFPAKTVLEACRVNQGGK